MHRHAGNPWPRDERGAGRLGCLLLLALVGIGIYAVIKIAAGEFAYRSVRETARQEAALGSERTDEEIRNVMLRRVRELELPPAAEAISIRRAPDGSVTISLSYADTVSFVDRWEWVRPRRVHASSNR